MVNPMAKSIAPPIIYHDGVNIYLEWSGHAQRYPFTEGGLNKALKAIPHIASAPGYVTGRSNIATKLLDTRKTKAVKVAVGKRTVLTATDAQRQVATDILRRFKVKQ